MISRRLSGFAPHLMVVGIMFVLIFTLAGSPLSADAQHKYDGVYTGRRSLAKAQHPQHAQPKTMYP